MPARATKTPTSVRMASFDHPSGTGTLLRFESGITRGIGQGVTWDGRANDTIKMIHDKDIIT